MSTTQNNDSSANGGNVTNSSTTVAVNGGNSANRSTTVAVNGDNASTVNNSIVGTVNGSATVNGSHVDTVSGSTTGTVNGNGNHATVDSSTALMDSVASYDQVVVNLGSSLRSPTPRPMRPAAFDVCLRCGVSVDVLRSYCSRCMGGIVYKNLL
ncbi:hypothetical protein BD626DRAFT_476346 [Schizophyllum amplum]|uniref:Uncharacterized protein n=1 Tax=Schizophyllum amplum TaxID=97359 RepID=A0A550CZA5_9AGAR|nr:hypothetical protein BD626DRAFT_476346 [Auriculariopsis ampla]